MNYIDIEDEYGAGKDYSEIIEKTVNIVAEKENLPSVNVCVLITDKEGIREINKENRNVDAPTDVLSFPYLIYDEDFNPIGELEDEKDPETGAICLGDMVICPDIIKEHAEEYGNTVEQELSYMVVHSMYHLLGYDHMEEEDKKKMRAKEKEIIDNN